MNKKMSPSVKITKLNAAKRQLESAILLYFNDGDPVSIHTLSAAAYNIVRDINSSRTGEMMAKDLWKFLSTDLAKEFKQHINKAEKFFKHADKDPKGLYTLNPGWTEALLAEASRKYSELTGEYPPYLYVFLTWFVIQHRRMFSECPDMARILNSIQVTTIPTYRAEFFSSFLPVVTRVPRP